MRRYNQVTGEYEWEPYPEIPLDGKQYARQYNPVTRKVEWVEVEASGGRPDAPINLALSALKPSLISSKFLLTLWTATSSMLRTMSLKAIVQQCTLFRLA